MAVLATDRLLVREFVKDDWRRACVPVPRAEPEVSPSDPQRPDHMVLGYSVDERERLLEEPFDSPAVAVCYLLGTPDGRVVFDLVAREARYPHRTLFAPLLQPIV